MRIFVAGGSGLTGVRLVPLLVAAGHEVAGMSRSADKAALPAAAAAAGRARVIAQSISWELPSEAGRRRIGGHQRAVLEAGGVAARG